MEWRWDNKFRFITIIFLFNAKNVVFRDTKVKAILIKTNLEIMLNFLSSPKALDRLVINNKFQTLNCFDFEIVLEFITEGRVSRSLNYPYLTMFFVTLK